MPRYTIAQDADPFCAEYEFVVAMENVPGDAGMAVEAFVFREGRN